MPATLHHLTTPTPDYRPYAAMAAVGHVVMLVAISLAISHSIRTAPSMVMQVRIVGVAQPTAAPPKVVPPEQVRTQDSAAPKEPPPDAKNLPESKATTKLMKALEPAKNEPKQDINAAKRPPVLDKTPDKKKVVKNDLKAKVVKNPEDYMAALNFIDKLQQQQLTPSPTLAAKATPDKPAGEGPQIQLNLSEQGEVDAIRQHIEDNWMRPEGLQTKDLATVIEVTVDPDGNVINQRVLESSGQSFYDQSILRAVRKAVPLPIPKDSYDKFKVLELHFAG